MSEHLKKTSKFLSLILRHQPERIGLQLDPEGWANLDQLIALANAHNQHLARELVLEIVDSNDKQRFSISADGARIRANQGHSVEVDLQLAPQVPPAQLFHGTATRFLDDIREQGLVKGSRQHVHLSAAIETAVAVGSRHGKPVVLTIHAEQMHRDGMWFYLSANGVWLTDTVAANYIDFPG